MRKHTLWGSWIGSKDRTREMAQPNCSSDEEKVSKEGRSCKVTCRWREMSSIRREVVGSGWDTPILAGGVQSCPLTWGLVPPHWRRHCQAGWAKVGCGLPIPHHQLWCPYTSRLRSSHPPSQKTFSSQSQNRLPDSGGNFADMIKLRISGWGDYARCNHKVLTREMQETQSL